MSDFEAEDGFLYGDTFFLRPWRVEDAEWYVKSRDEAIFQWTMESPELTVEQTVVALGLANNDPASYCFAIVDQNINDLVGNIALLILENGHQAEMMYWLAPEGRGRGIATKSVRLLRDWASQALEIDQIVLKTHVNNTASQRVAERAGFRRWKDIPAKYQDIDYQWFEYTGEH